MNQNDLHLEMAFKNQLDNERRIAKAELRRQAKATRRVDGSSDRAVAARLAAMAAVGSVAGAWRWLGRGLVVAVGRRQPA